MPFSRKPIDENIDRMMTMAKQAGVTSEALFLIDAPLREYIVAIEQMMAEGANPNDICDASVSLVCSIITNLASTTNATNPDTFVAFSNTFMYEVSVAMTDAVNRVNKDQTKEYGVEVFDPNRTEH